MKIGNFESAARLPDSPADDAVLSNSHGVVNVPLDAFPTDKILSPQSPILDQEGVSHLLIADKATSTIDTRQAETPLQAPPDPEIQPMSDLHESASLNLQQHMDQHSRRVQILSNVTQSTGDAMSNIVDNIK